MIVKGTNCLKQRERKSVETGMKDLLAVVARQVINSHKSTTRTATRLTSQKSCPTKAEKSASQARRAPKISERSRENESARLV
jgi:hypothetical protein